MSLLETFDELAAEDFAENVLGEEEAKAPGMHPVRVIVRETAGGDYAMNMRMVLQLLIPGMENAEETNLGPEVPGICGDLDQSLGAGAEEQSIDHFLVLKGQRRQLMRKREYHMSVGSGQQFGPSRFEPAVARLALALRAVPVAAGVIGDGAMAAA